MIVRAAIAPPWRPALYFLALALVGCGDSGAPTGNQVVEWTGQAVAECVYIADFVEVTRIDLSRAPQRIQVAAQGLPGNVQCPDLPEGWTTHEGHPVPPPENPHADWFKRAIEKGKPIALQVLRRAHR